MHQLSWSCNFCDESFDKFVLYEEHLSLKHSDEKQEPDSGVSCEKSIKKDDLCCSICKWFWVIDHDELDLCLRVYNDKRYCKKCVSMLDKEKNIMLKYGNYLEQITMPIQSHEKQLWVERKVDLRDIQQGGVYEIQFECCYCIDTRDNTESFYHLPGWSGHEICERCYYYAVINKNVSYQGLTCKNWCQFNNHLERKVNEKIKMQSL